MDKVVYELTGSLHVYAQNLDGVRVSKKTEGPKQKPLRTHATVFQLDLVKAKFLGGNLLDYKLSRRNSPTAGYNTRADTRCRQRTPRGPCNLVGLHHRW